MKKNRMIQTEASAYKLLNDDKLMEVFCDMGQNIVGKGENVGFLHFLLFPQFFPKLCSS